jgi:hypothetical protein
MSGPENSGHPTASMLTGVCEVFATEPTISCATDLPAGTPRGTVRIQVSLNEEGKITGVGSSGAMKPEQFIAASAKSQGVQVCALLRERESHILQRGRRVCSPVVFRTTDDRLLWHRAK